MRFLAVGSVCIAGWLTLSLRVDAYLFSLLFLCPCLHPPPVFSQLCVRAGRSEDVQFFEDFLIREYEERLVQVLREKDAAAHYSIEIDLIPHAVHATILKVLSHPLSMLPLLDEAGRDAQTTLAARLDGEAADGRQLTVKCNAHVRVVSVPSRMLRAVSALRSADVGTFICVTGTVIRTGGVMMCEVDRTYSCAKCGHVFPLSGDIAQRGEFRLPSVCPAQVPGRKACGGTRFNREERAFSCREYQEIKLQEQIKSLGVGSVPRSLLVVLTDELADSVKPGDDVEVVGILHRRWHRNPTQGQRSDVELMLAATGVSLTNARKSFLQLTDEAIAGFERFWEHHRTTPLAGRDTILQSLCPQLYGMYITKLIVAMSLIGGVARRDEAGTNIRGESHLLIVGDPGTAKSQILRYAALLSPRAVLTTGIGTTSAGLTTSAVRDAGSGQWMLDAGALVLADGGLCCIDEFDSIRESDRGSIHEAMEQQTLSVAKAGLVCTLSTRTTVFAAVNPKAGKLGSTIYVPTTDVFSTPGGGSHPADGGSAGGAGSTSKTLPIELAIAAPLLSRFDVVLTLLDRHDEAWDKALSTFILDGCRLSGAAAAAEASAAAARWPLERLRQYMFYVKNRLHPRLSREARLILSRYYSAERGGDGRNVARTTVRLMEALIRLTVAHARLMFRRHWATAQDAAFAVAAVESSAVSQPVLGGGSALHAPFPTQPDAAYKEYVSFLESRLKLEGAVPARAWTPLAADGSADAANMGEADDAVAGGTPYNEDQEDTDPPLSATLDKGGIPYDGPDREDPGRPLSASLDRDGTADDADREGAGRPLSATLDEDGSPAVSADDEPPPSARGHGGGSVGRAPESVFSTPALYREGDAARVERNDDVLREIAVGTSPERSLVATPASAGGPRGSLSVPTSAVDDGAAPAVDPSAVMRLAQRAAGALARRKRARTPAGSDDEDGVEPSPSPGRQPNSPSPRSAFTGGTGGLASGRNDGGPPCGATTPVGAARTLTAPAPGGAPSWTQPKAAAAASGGVDLSDNLDVFKGLEDDDDDDDALGGFPFPVVPPPSAPAAVGGGGAAGPQRVPPRPSL